MRPGPSAVGRLSLRRKASMTVRLGMFARPCQSLLSESRLHLSMHELATITTQGTNPGLTHSHVSRGGPGRLTLHTMHRGKDPPMNKNILATVCALLPGAGTALGQAPIGPAHAGA